MDRATGFELFLPLSFLCFAHVQPSMAGARQTSESAVREVESLQCDDDMRPRADCRSDADRSLASANLPPRNLRVNMSDNLTRATRGNWMHIAAIERQTTADLVVERLARVIKEQNLSAGERLPGEHELVEQLKVSRPVLREALARLQSMGLVDIQRGRGTFVGNRTSLANCVQLLRSAVTISPQELRSYTELRTAIEVQAARQAAELATEDDVAELTALWKQLDDEELPYPEMLELDFRFHRKLIDIAGNPLMQNMMEVIYEFVLAQMARTTPSQRENALGRKLHKAILRAICERDGDAAASAMQQHMQAVLDRLARQKP